VALMIGVLNNDSTELSGVRESEQPRDSSRGVGIDQKFGAIWLVELSETRTLPEDILLRQHQITDARNCK